MAISTAVGLDRRSTIIGYALAAGNFASSSPNLPQSILVIGQANTDKVSGLALNSIERHFTAKEVGDKYGYGSPLHRAMRILKPVNADGVGGIPVFFAAQSDAAQTATVVDITVTGTVTLSTSIPIQIGGQSLIDGKSLNVSIQIGDTADIVMDKIRDAINNCISAEYSASFISGTDTKVTATSKFKGLISNVRLDIDLPPGTGLTIATSIVDGTGHPTVTTTLNNIGDMWITAVVNTYSNISTDILDELTAFNGRPGENPTGRYSGTVMKPFVAFTGVITVLQLATAQTWADGVQNEDTISFSPAYGSKGSVYEAAANYALMQTVLSQTDPSRDVINTNFNMPAPYDFNLAQMSYDQRDFLCKSGVSTCVWDSNISSYVVKDLITTYRVDTEVEPSFRWVRDIYIDFNIKFKYYLMQQSFVIGKVIVPDSSAIPSNNSSNVISPKVFKALVLTLIDELESDGLITDREFTKASLQVEIDSTNPNRFNCRFDYKRTGIARISSTNVLAGHFFG